MSEIRFHSDSMHALGSSLLQPDLASGQELLYIENNLLRNQINELKELTQMQYIDIESHKVELMNLSNQYDTKLTTCEIDILNLRMELCQRHIDICQLRFELFKLMRVSGMNNLN